jgi:hypothetical protein
MTAAMTQVPTAILIVAKTSKAFLPSLESSLTKRMSTLFALQYSIACCNMGRSTFFFAPEKGAMVPDPIAPFFISSQAGNNRKDTFLELFA